MDVVIIGALASRIGSLLHAHLYARALGGGIMGCSTAYYLLSSPDFDAARDSVTLVEDFDIAGAASGKAAGFLAEDWHGPATASLGRLSFKLHHDLAEAYEGKDAWGYRRMTSCEVEARATEEYVKSEEDVPEENIALAGSAMRARPEASVGQAEDWLDHVDSQENVSSTESTAQVEPKLFTQAMFHLARKRGLKFIRGTPTSFRRSTQDQLESISVHVKGGSPEVIPSDAQEEAVLSLPCTKLVLTTGPWTGALAEKLGLKIIPVTNLPGHSVILQPQQSLPATAVFSSIYGKGSDRSFTGSPEMFPRPDGTIYIAGENGGVDLPLSAAEVADKLKESSVQKLLRSAQLISTGLELSQAKLIKSQLCFRPITADLAPIIGEVEENIYVCSGHGPWGISLGPGSGKVMSELILPGAVTSADISGLGLDRFPATS